MDIKTIMHNLDTIQSVVDVIVLLAWCILTYTVGKLMSILIGDLAMFCAGMIYLQIVNKRSNNLHKSSNSV